MDSEPCLPPLFVCTVFYLMVTGQNLIIATKRELFASIFLDTRCILYHELI